MTYDEIFKCQNISSNFSWDVPTFNRPVWTSNTTSTLIPIIEPPEGYKIVEDLNYIIKQEDLFYNSEFDIEFRKIDLRSHGHRGRLIGYTIKFIKETWIFYGHAGYIIASKNEIKPRFPCNKPYPYGY